MSELYFFKSHLFTLGIMPVLIFFARIIDVSMGTLRIIFVARDRRLIASILGFFEVLIWLVAITQIIRNVTSPIHYIAYAAGFGMGNFVGISIERKLSMGNLMIRIITRKEARELANFLRSNDYMVTSVNAEGSTGPVEIVFTVIKRRNLGEVLGIIKKFNPNAFYTIEDIKFVTESQARHLYTNQKSNFLHRLTDLFQKRK